VKVLIIDDNPETAYLLSTYLNSEGIENNITNDPIDGLEKIKERGYDTVLLDISMSEFSGINIVHTRGLEERLEDQKVIIFSAKSFTDDEIPQLLQKEGLQVCISKPINPNKVLTSITC
jgi:CheY-like chemotaxis protein